MREMLLDRVNNFLDAHESAASAHYLVYSLLNDDENGIDVEEFYEMSDGLNDSQREKLLSKATNDQLMLVASSALEICLEKLEEAEEE